MWTYLAKRASSTKFKLPSESFYLPSSSNSRSFSRHWNFPEKIKPARTQILPGFQFLGFDKVGVFAPRNELGGSSFSFSEEHFGFSKYLKLARYYGSAAEAIESTTDTEDDCPTSNEVQKLLEHMLKEEEKGKAKAQVETKNGGVEGMANYKFKMLRKRQIKVETEAWEEAAKEYQV